MKLKEKVRGVTRSFIMWRYGFRRYTENGETGYVAPHTNSVRYSDKELNDRFDVADNDELTVWCECAVPEHYWRIKPAQTLGTMLDTHEKIRWLKKHKHFFSTMSGAISNGHGVSLYPEEVREMLWQDIKEI